MYIFQHFATKLGKGKEINKNEKVRNQRYVALRKHVIGACASQHIVEDL